MCGPLDVWAKRITPATAVMSMIADGKFHPVIDKVVPLEQASEGLRLIADREVIGKVVVTP